MPHWLSIFKTFGFLVALSFIAAAWATTQELKRKEQQGLLHPTVGNVKDKKGNVVKANIWPHQRLSDITILAAVGGLVGAKIFNAFETWDDFIQHPIDNLISNSGLTFLGGLIVAALVIYFYAKKHQIPYKHLCDAAAPGIMLAYGIGRLGCQFSGDGDWGIYNTAYVTNADSTLRAATAADKSLSMQLIGNTPSAFAPAPSWLPRWLFGMNYPHNGGHEGIPIHGCVGDYCNVLPVSVFPTPIYEAITCIILFFVLWAVRKRFTRSLQMFGTYLILVGVERFFVELIRVNYKYDLGFVHPTQAEILSIVLVILGACLLLFYKDKTTVPPDPKAEVIT